MFYVLRSFSHDSILQLQIQLIQEEIYSSSLFPRNVVVLQATQTKTSAENIESECSSTTWVRRNFLRKRMSYSPSFAMTLLTAASNLLWNFFLCFESTYLNNICCRGPGQWIQRRLLLRKGSFQSYSASCYDEGAIRIRRRPRLFIQSRQVLSIKCT